MTRPFISFLTDFGLDGAAAICRGVMLSIASDAQIVDISHSVQKYRIRDGAFLLWMALRWMPVGIHVAVVDPGVGSARRPIAIRVHRGDVLVGPDNGLLMPAAETLGGMVGVRQLGNADWLLPTTSATFHGRDVFAPVAGHLARGDAFESVGPAVDPASLTELRFPEAVVAAGRLETSVVYVDSFGNLRFGATSADLEAALGSGGDAKPTGIEVELDRGDGSAPVRERAHVARTFNDVEPGRPLLYVDSNGQLTYADNQGSAASRLRIGEDARAVIRR
jgi:S-adenosylmethionine hydrolase